MRRKTLHKSVACLDTYISKRNIGCLKFKVIEDTRNMDFWQEQEFKGDLFTPETNKKSRIGLTMKGHVMILDYGVFLWLWSLTKRKQSMILNNWYLYYHFCLPQLVCFNHKCYITITWSLPSNYWQDWVTTTESQFVGLGTNII